VTLLSQDDTQWRERLAAASRRYDQARIAVLQAASEQRELPPPDGGLNYRHALQEETDALNQYAQLITEYSRLIVGIKDPTSEP